MQQSLMDVCVCAVCVCACSVSGSTYHDDLFGVPERLLVANVQPLRVLCDQVVGGFTFVHHTQHVLARFAFSGSQKETAIIHTSFRDQSCTIQRTMKGNVRAHSDRSTFKPRCSSVFFGVSTPQETYVIRAHARTHARVHALSARPPAHIRTSLVHIRPNRTCTGTTQPTAHHAGDAPHPWQEMPMHIPSASSRDSLS